MKDLNYYLALPYTVVLRPDDEGDVVARIEELPGCTAHGASPLEALQNLEREKRGWIEIGLEEEREIPEPLAEEALPSGKWVQRVPRSLHAKLTRKAKAEGVSLNQFVTVTLAEAVSARPAPDPLALYYSGNAVTPYQVQRSSIHEGWFVDDVTPVPTYVICVGAASIHGSFVKGVRHFSKSVPDRFSVNLKAIEDETTEKNRTLSRA